MTKTMKLIFASAASAALALVLVYSFLDRAREAEAGRFDWETVNGLVQARGPAAAAAAVDERLASHPNDALLHYFRARLYYSAGKGAETAAEADKAISLGYAQEMSHILKAMASGRLLGDYAAQKKLASKALALDPTYEFAYLIRAEAEYALGEYKPCASDAASYQHMRPKDADGFEYGLLCLERLGDYAGAETAGLRVLAIDRKSHSGLWRLGRLYAAQGLHKRAIKKFTEAIKLSQGRPKYYLDRAASCAAEGDFYCEAWDYYSAMGWQEVSGYTSYYYLLGGAMYRIGDLKPALEVTESGLKMDPLNPDGYELRGRLRAELGDPAGAKKDLLKASSLSPSRSAETAALLGKLKGR